jgi:hypothetical protein
MIKFNIVISTQVHENYGAHDWDGKGQCPQYWKAKGGYEYRHPIALDLTEVQDRSKVSSFVEELRIAVTRNDDSWQEYVIDWYLLPVGELTHEEKQQVEWHGSVKEPTKSPYKLQNAYAA